MVNDLFFALQAGLVVLLNNLNAIHRVSNEVEELVRQ
jgi:hypothetical protein